MSAIEKAQGIVDAERARAELYDTLGKLKVQLNYAKRVDDALEDTRMKIVATKRRNPAAFFAGVAGVAVVTGLVVWGVAAAVAKRFD
ncbi:hypothetical protein JD292_08615 [Leucobacter sp. CSA2]|uniref:DUF3618 domain-containing protein n=1 Tax=Leucobacter edaphi TaxID=2796472 RepID=A0A934UXY1_9MICO|nr:hypothetical protein [Leucobacter edaphi]MBK0422136.1 hypothetical protein [Leucobacter edaphi]